MHNIGQIAIGIILIIFGLWAFFKSKKWVDLTVAQLKINFSEFEISLMRIFSKFGAVLFIILGFLSMFGVLR